MHLLNGSATTDGSAAAEAEANTYPHCARPGQESFHERSFKLLMLAVKMSERLCERRTELIDEIATRAVRGSEGGQTSRKEAMPFKTYIAIQREGGEAGQLE